MLKYRERWKQAATYLATGLLASGVILFLLAEFHEEIIEPFLTGLDVRWMQAVHAHASSPLTAFMLSCSFIGSLKIFLPASLILAALLWWRRHRSDSLLVLIAIAGGAVLNVGLKLHFRRVRPDVPWALAHEHSFSFPSGHSLFAVVLYGVVAYLLLLRTRGAGARIAIVASALAIVFCIGLSRVYVGVHYPTDVAAGWMVGSIWLAAVIVSDWKVRRDSRNSLTSSSDGF